MAVLVSWKMFSIGWLIICISIVDDIFEVCSEISKSFVGVVIEKIVSVNLNRIFFSQLVCFVRKQRNLANVVIFLPIISKILL